MSSWGWDRGWDEADEDRCEEEAKEEGGAAAGDVVMTGKLNGAMLLM